MSKKNALIMIDIQNDFCEGGSLAVPKGDEIIPIVNQLQHKFDRIIATQDWHPQTHVSFASNHPNHNVGEVLDINHTKQVLWPDHCVQNTKGAELHPALNTQKITKIIFKGSNKNIDSYSAFFDNAHLHATGLEEYLRIEQVEDIYMVGLATDYCVKYSALDARQLGFNVYIIADACRGIDLNPGDIVQALEEMQRAGVKIIEADTIL